MKPASPALIALLATRQFYSADLYQFDIFNGSVAETNLYYCGGDKDIIWNGITWSSGHTGSNSGPFFDRKDNKAKCHWKIGVEVDSLVFDCIPGGATIGGEPFLSFCRQGGFDGAELTLYRAFMPTYGNTAAGTVIMFVGRVAEIDASRSLATFTVNSHLELLNQNMPRNLYQSACSNTLYDANCTLNQTSFGVSGTVASGSTASVINANLSQPAGYFSLGQLTFTSGANQGFSGSVQSYTPGAPGMASVISPFPSAPAPGDTFTIYPGCNKLLSTCSSKFSNAVNYRGEPNIPNPSTAV
ncbi:MAG TPA: DUF2163 domain-containing protein [Bryobacteraceae bacterium]|jgi:uncharacterized phage protein (TIGR02218 family)|nr:DUF2163 domain-containing protein [Bryobacteraceae bacterium]